MCLICDEYKPFGFHGACPCCSNEVETKTVECEYCDGLGFFPYYNGDYISAKEYRKLPYYEKCLVNKNEWCLECGGIGEIEK
jgi:hypothetical protein